MAPRKKNPWTSTSEILLWLLFVALVFPAAFAGYAVGHYTSLGKPPKTVTETVGSTSTPTTTTSMTTTTSSGGDVAAGKTVFAGVGGCGGCHTFGPAGSNSSIGPDLGTAPTMDAATDGNMALAAFIRESITHPSAYIAKNYTDGIMPSDFSTRLTSTQIDDLVAFILSGTN